MIYLKISRGEFPKPFSLGARSVAWKESEVNAWMASRVESTLSNNRQANQ